LRWGVVIGLRFWLVDVLERLRIEDRKERLLGIGFNWSSFTKSCVCCFDEGQKIEIDIGCLASWTDDAFEASFIDSKSTIEARRAEKKRLLDEQAAELARLAKEKKDREDKEEAERKAKEKAERDAKMAPDKEKLIAFADKIKALSLEEITLGDEADKVFLNAQILLDKVVKYLTDNSEKL